MVLGEGIPLRPGHCFPFAHHSPPKGRSFSLFLPYLFLLELILAAVIMSDQIPTLDPALIETGSGSFSAGQ